MKSHIAVLKLTTTLNGIIPGLWRGVLGRPSRAIQVVDIAPAPHFLIAWHGVDVLAVDGDVQVVQGVQPVELIGPVSGHWK